jgi:hypothetical protein
MTGRRTRARARRFVRRIVTTARSGWRAVIGAAVSTLLLSCTSDQLPLGCPADAPATPGADRTWPTEPGCLQPAFTSDFAPRQAEIEAAFEAWRITCGCLCFEALVENNDSDPPERGIRIGAIGDSFAPNAELVTRTTYGVEDGQHRAAEILLDPANPNPVHRLLLYAIGKVIGFDNVEDSLSVMNPVRDDNLVRPTAYDVDVYFANYGACPG